MKFESTRACWNSIHRDRLKLQYASNWYLLKFTQATSKFHSTGRKFQSTRIFNMQVLELVEISICRLQGNFVLLELIWNFNVQTTGTGWNFKFSMQATRMGWNFRKTENINPPDLVVNLIWKLPVNILICELQGISIYWIGWNFNMQANGIGWNFNMQTTRKIQSTRIGQKFNMQEINLPVKF